MRKLLLFAVCSIFYCSYAQLPPNSFGPDFTLTDINGEEFNLHSTLDEGKTVILDLFAKIVKKIRLTFSTIWAASVWACVRAFVWASVWAVVRASARGACV